MHHSKVGHAASVVALCWTIFECPIDVRFTPKADIAERHRHVRFWGKADSCSAANVAYSITSSAETTSEDGMLMPSALAVVRLITVSNFVGACTGKSAGFSPLRIRST